MLNLLIQFITLFLLMLVTGVFWGPWLSLHRSLHVFKADEFVRIVKTLASNLAGPMRILMPSCILGMLLTAYFFSQKSSVEFYLNIAAIIFMIVFFLITILVELPIVTNIQKWTQGTIPGDWERIRDRWVKFHVIRTFASIASFLCFASSIYF